MIKSLKVKNFQSHKKTFLKFNKGLNVISGKSDSGKSAIKRIIRWITDNKPSGDSFRSHWGGTVSVILKTDKNVIKKVRKKSNTYYLNNKKFASCGRDIPNEIKNAIRISDIGIQNQFDPPFLFSLSGGEISKFINKIVDIEIIDTSISNINRMIKKEKDDYKRIKTLLLQKKEEQKRYSWVKEGECLLIDLESCDVLIKSKKTLIDSTEQVLREIRFNRIKYSKITSLTNDNTLNSFNRITKLYKSIKKNQVVLVNVDDLLKSESILRRNLMLFNDKLRDNEQKLKKILKICPFCYRSG